MKYVPGKVSIIGSYFNRGRYVEASILSLLSQEYDNFDIILIDDGSTDDTLEALQSFDDPRIRVESQANIGNVRSLRRAIELSDAEFISIHDAGDLSEPSLLDHGVEMLLQHPNVGVVATWITDTDVASAQAPVIKAVDLGPDPAVSFLSGAKISHGGTLYRRRLYDEVGGYRPWFNYAQDHDLWLRMSERCNIMVIPDCLYHRQKFVQGVSTTPEKRAWQIFLSEFAVYCAKERRRTGIDPLDEYGEVSSLALPRSRRLGNQYASASLGALVAGDRFRARTMAIASLKHAPSPRQRIAMLITKVGSRSRWAFKAVRFGHERSRRMQS